MEVLITYKNLRTDDIVRLVITPPHDDNAAYYILFTRCVGVLHNVYNLVFDKKGSWFEDCQSDIYNYLRGEDGEWKKLGTYSMDNKFNAWLKTTSYRRFLYMKPKLMSDILEESKPLEVYDEQNDTIIIQVPDSNVEETETTERRVMLYEAIGQLKNDTQKFCILKDLQGYDHEEIADMLAQKWEREGTRKLRKIKGQTFEIVPTADYINVQIQRCKIELKKHLEQYR